MSALAQAINELKKQRSSALQEVKRLDEALRLLQKMAAKSPKASRGAGGAARRHRISAAGRKRISDAQKARWAKARTKRAS